MVDLSDWLSSRLQITRNLKEQNILLRFNLEQTNTVWSHCLTKRFKSNISGMDCYKLHKQWLITASWFGHSRASTKLTTWMTTSNIHFTWVDKLPGQFEISSLISQVCRSIYSEPIKIIFLQLFDYYLHSSVIDSLELVSHQIAVKAKQLEWSSRQVLRSSGNSLHDS